LDCAVSLIAATGYGQVAHEDGVSILECEARFFLVPGEYVERSDVRLVQLVAHELERAHGLGAIHDDFALVIDDAAAERSEIFHEAGDQPLVARALPDDSIAWPTATRHRRLGVRHHLLERLRLIRNEVGATIEKPDVREPRQRVEFSCPRVGRDRCWKKLRSGRPVLVERQDPPRRRELRSPDDVELEDGRIAHPGIEPLDVELVPLRRVVGRALELDPDSGIELHKPL